MSDTTFGKYRLIASIGQGSTAQLHIAEQTGIEGFSKIVALKRILPHLGSRPEFRKIFFDDARLIAGLDHPNLATVYELGEIDGSYFVSLEYLAGEDLAQITTSCRKRSSPVPIEFALSIAQECAGALHFAHELSGSDGTLLGVVHRDLTPANVMLTAHGVAKVLDCGLTKLKSFAKSPYAAPELVAGQKVDLRADIYSLGVVLWEMLTGEQPPLQRALPPPSTFRPEIPTELDEFVLKAVARSPAKRHQSAIELTDEIDQFMRLQYNPVSANALARWLEDLFGAERIAAKRSLAQGHNVRDALAVIARGPSETRAASEKAPISRHAMRSAWSTDQAGGFSIFSQLATQSLTPTSSTDLPVTFTDSLTSQQSQPGAPPLPPLRPQDTLDVALLSNLTTDFEAPVAKKNGWVIAAGALLILGGVLTFGLINSSGEHNEPVATRAEGSLEIISEPPGALVFLNGEPTGQMTPAKIAALAAGKPIEVRLDKPGMAQATQTVVLEAGQLLVKIFQLSPAGGLVKFTRVPRSSLVFVDDQRVDSTAPVLLEAGVHKIRVENSRDILFERVVEVKLGEQEIDLGGS